MGVSIILEERILLIGCLNLGTIRNKWIQGRLKLKAQLRLIRRIN